MYYHHEALELDQRMKMKECESTNYEIPAKSEKKHRNSFSTVLLNYPKQLSHVKVHCPS